MRKIFYKVDLKLSNDQVLPITVATTDINNVGQLVEKYKMLYKSTTGHEVVGLEITDIKYTVDMPEKEYEEELMFCDIVDEDI